MASAIFTPEYPIKKDVRYGSRDMDVNCNQQLKCPVVIAFYVHLMEY